jgi:hypothetical protein
MRPEKQTTTDGFSWSDALAEPRRCRRRAIDAAKPLVLGFGSSKRRRTRQLPHRPRERIE